MLSYYYLTRYYLIFNIFCLSYHSNKKSNIQQRNIGILEHKAITCNKTDTNKNGEMKKMRKEVEKQFIKTVTGSYISLGNPKCKTTLLQCIYDYNSNQLREYIYVFFYHRLISDIIIYNNKLSKILV